MSLALVLLASPLLGLTLQAPALEPTHDFVLVAAAQLSLSAEADLSGSADGDEEGDAEQPDVSPASAARAKRASPEQDEYRSQIRTRNDLIKLHQPLGIATWAAMTATVGLGLIQYYNLYGFGADQGSNPCVKGTAIFGQGACTGRPWPHTLAASLTTGLYASTFVVSVLMPDPDDLASGPGEFASTLRMHKILRWVHFGGMITQLVLGLVVATDIAGLDRANDYDTLQALATVHMATGLVTYGALTWAGALMTF